MKRIALFTALVAGCTEPPAPVPPPNVVVAIEGSASARPTGPPSHAARATHARLGWYAGAEGAAPCAIDATNTLHCWALEVHCALGEALEAPVTQGVVSLASGARHSCALLTDGKVRCWGANFSAQLGRPEDPDHPELAQPAPAVSLAGPASAVSAGFDHSCAVLKDGRVQCWGDNSTGQLGVPAIPPEAPRRSLPADPTRLVAIPTLADVGAGGGHTCGLRGDGSVRCWGDARGDKLGHTQPLAQALETDLELDGPARLVVTGTWTNCALLADGAVQCWGENEYGQLCRGGPSRREPTTIPLPRPAVTVALSESRACAVLDDGALACWGGRCQAPSCGGVDDTPPEPCAPTVAPGAVTAVALSYAATCTLDRSGVVACSCNVHD